MPTKTIAYLRVSTDKQADRGVSLDAQRAKVAACAELYDLELAEIIVETLVERYFAPGKAALLSVGEQIDTRSAAGRLVLNVLASVSQWEREAIGERTATAMQHKARQGEYTGGWAPYGRRVAPDGARLEPDPHEEAARTVARQLRAQGFSLRGIAAELHQRASGAGRGEGSRRCRCRGWWAKARWCSRSDRIRIREPFQPRVGWHPPDRSSQSGRDSARGARGRASRQVARDRL